MTKKNQSLLAYVKVQDAVDFAILMLKGQGVNKDDSVKVAECLVEADLRGVQTHGMSRLPIYVKRLSEGLINATPKMILDKPVAACASLDGDNGLGFLVGIRAIQEAIKMAETCGVGVVAAQNSNHFGMAATYLLQAVQAGYFAFVFTNAAKSMPPWGGREGLFGTSPFAAGAPGGKLPPFILDMSPAVAARGKIRLAEKRGEAIPEGYALDENGKPTTDPTAALRGVVLPIGGYKGSGLSMLMEILAGVFTGANFGGDVPDQYTVWDRPQNVGHFFMVLKPGVFVTEKGFRDRMDILVSRVKENPRAGGFDEIFMPGEIEARLEIERRQSGIPYAQSDILLLTELAREYNIAEMPYNVH
ncbi:Ldh family oxidoreductase [Candidatus Puniceispirillum sp.]|nr:Ldh family oxidoreductase [Candidatus Puniceispirillum sp.]